MKKTVSTSGARTRLLWASCISVSKSLMARRPRTIAAGAAGAAEVDGQAVERVDLDAVERARRPRVEGLADDRDPRLDGRAAAPSAGWRGPRR